MTPIYLNTAGEDGCGLFVNNDAFDRVMGRSALEQVELARQRRAAMILLTASYVPPLPSVLRICRRLLTATDRPLTDFPSAHPRHRTICPVDRPAAFYQGLAVKFTPLERSTAVFKVRRCEPNCHCVCVLVCLWSSELTV